MGGKKKIEDKGEQEEREEVRCEITEKKLGGKN